MSCKLKKGDNRGVSLISLVIAIIILIILALLFIGTTSNMPDEATYAKFVQEINNVQEGVLQTRLDNSSYGDTEEKINAGFRKVVLLNAPEGFESFDYTGNTITGYIVGLDTIGYENAYYGKSYGTDKDEIEFNKDDVYVYDATGAVYYVKGLEYNKGKVYSIANISASGVSSSEDGPVITNIVVTSGELDNGAKTSAKAKIIVSALPRYGGKLNIMVRNFVAEEQPDGTYATQVSRNGTYTIIVTEENGGRTVSKVLVTGIIESIEPPQNLSMIIHDNGGFTQSADVDITVRADGASKMLIAKNNPLRPSSIDSNWQEYNEDFQYNLGTVEGKITLYAWFMDDFGNITENIVKASTTYDKTAPTTDTPTLTVTGPYVIVTSNQTDKISTKEYLESTMRYGYRKATGGVVDESTFTWVSNKLINSLENRNTYEFVTKATDEAGNTSISGIAIAEVNYDITIKFDLTGGNGSFDNMYTKEGISITLPLEKPTKLGYIFVGWSENQASSADSSDIRRAGELYTPTGSQTLKTLYAIWEANPDTPYKVYHYIEKAETPGEYEVALVEDLKGVTGKEVYAVAKTDGEFKGLVENITHSQRLVMTTLQADGSTELRIYYDRVRYTLTLKAVNGTVTPAVQQVAYGTSVQLTAKANPGYYFYKWEIEGAGDNDSDYDNFTNSLGSKAQNAVFKMPDKNITLIANYRTQIFSITYELNGGTIGAENPIEYSKETAVFTLNNPTKIGYDFIGWVGTELSVATKVVTIDPSSMMVLGDRKYTAIYEPAENLIQITATPDGPTKEKVIATISCLDKSLDVEYRVGNASGWSRYNKAIEITENTTVYARGLSNGSVVYEKNLVIANIDTEKPVIKNVTLSDNWVKGEDLKLHVDVTDNLALGSYAISASDVVPSDSEFVELGNNKDVVLDKSGSNYIWIKDIAGNAERVLVKAYDISKNLNKMVYAVFFNDDANMIIVGNGETKSYANSEVPYRSFRSKVKTIEIINGVTTLGDNIISSMTNVKTISIPLSLDEIAEDAMSYTNNFTDIKIAPGNQSFIYTAFTLYDIAKTNIYAHSSADERQTYEIDNTVVKIRKLAFYNNDNIRKITVTSNPTLEYGSFEDCSNLVEINGKIGNTTIKDNTFARCTSLEMITLSDTLKSIGNAAFVDTKHLAMLTIPKSVVAVGNIDTTQNGVFKNIGINAGNTSGKGIVRYYQSSSAMVKYANNFSTEATFVLIDDVAASLVDFRVDSPATGTYPVGTEIKFVAEFSEELDSERTAPTLTIKIGNGSNKAVTNVKYDKNNIIYKYVPVEGEEGQVNVVELNGAVYDFAGNVTNVSRNYANGSNITIETFVKLEEGTQTYYFSKLQDAVNTCKQKPEMASKITLLKDITESVNISSGKYIELNVNGKVLEAEGNTVLIRNSANLEITGSGSIVSNESSIIENTSNAVLAMSNISVNCNTNLNTAIINYSQSKLDINNVTINSEGVAICNNGKLFISNSSLTSSTENIIQNMANSTAIIISSDIVLNATDRATYAIDIRDTSVMSLENVEIVARDANGISNYGVLEVRGISTNMNATKVLTAYGTTRIYDGTYSNTDTEIPLIENNGNLNVYDGTYVSQNQCALLNKGGVTNIYSGDIASVSTYATLSNDTNAELNVYGGNVENKFASAITNNGRLLITGTANIVASGTDGTIYNEGSSELIITGGTITKNSAGGAAILNENSGNVKADGANIQSKGDYAIHIVGDGNISLKDSTISLVTTFDDGAAIYSNSTGNIRIDNSTIEASSTTVSTSAINISAGSLELLSGSIKAVGINNTSGIKNNGCKITAGTLDSSIDVNIPTIEGSKYGYYEVNTGTFNFYDGKFIGAVDSSIVGTVTSKPDSTFIKKTLNGSVETSILVADYDKPTNVTLVASPNNWTNTDVTLTGKAEDDNSGIIAYAFSENKNAPAESEWTTLTSSVSQITQNYTVTKHSLMYFYVKDLTGNIAVSNVAEAFIDKIAPEIIGITQNPTNWTKDTVTLSITAHDDLSGISGYEITDTYHDIADTSKITYITPANNITQEIKTGNGTWYIYLIDQAGNVKYTSYIVNTIDNIAPTINVDVSSYQTESITIKIEATDAESGVNKITINNVELGLINSSTKQNTVETTYTITSSDTFNIEAIDVVGNKSTFITETYYITYSSNSDNSETINEIKLKNISRKISENTFSKYGFEFDSWNTKQDGTGTKYVPNSDYTLNENTTLYAIWKDISDPRIFDISASDDWIPGNSSKVKLHITADDNVGVTEYAITNSEIVPTIWSTLPDIDLNIIDGSYFAWVKDAAGNYVNYEFDLYDISAAENTNSVVAIYIDKEGGNELNIYGNGKTQNYVLDTVPWKDYKENIAKITINEGITSIGNYLLSGLFSEVAGDLSISIPNTITDISQTAFVHSTGISNVAINNDKFKYSNGVLYDTDKIIYVVSKIEADENIVIPFDVKEIAPYAFEESKANSITIMSNVSLPEGAFYNSTSLTTLNTPNGIGGTSIGKSAFEGCNNLKFVEISKEVVTINDRAFYNAEVMTEIIIPETVTQIIGTNVFTNIGKKEPAGKGVVYYYDSCTAMGEYATNQATKDQAIFIPLDNIPPVVESVTINSGDKATFDRIVNVNVVATDNREVKYIYITEDPHYIPDKTDSWTRYVSGEATSYQLSAENGVKTIYVWAKDERGNVSIDCKEASIILIEGVFELLGDELVIQYVDTTGKNYYEYRDAGYTLSDEDKYSINVRNNVNHNSIGSYEVNYDLIFGGEVIYTFTRNVRIISNSWNSSIYTQGEYRYVLNNTGEYAKIVEYANSSNSNTLVLPDYLGANDKYRVIDIGNGTTSICANDKAAYIKNITLPNYAIAISDYAFTNFTKLTVFDYSDTMMTIGMYAFSDNKDSWYDLSDDTFSRVIIKGNVREVKKNAFRGRAINNLIIENGVKSIDEGAFYETMGMEGEILNIPGSIEYLGDFSFAGRAVSKIIVSSENNYYKDVDQKALLSKDGTKFCLYAGRDTAKEYTIPDGVDEILWWGALSRATNLEKVTLADSTGKISGAAFRNDINLKNIENYDALTEIGTQAFWNTGLEKFEVPTGVKIINTSTFEESKLADIYLHDEITDVKDLAYCNISNLNSVVFAGNPNINNNVFEASNNLRSIVMLDNTNIAQVVNGDIKISSDTIIYTISPEMEAKYEANSIWKKLGTDRIEILAKLNGGDIALEHSRPYVEEGITMLGESFLTGNGISTKVPGFKVTCTSNVNMSVVGNYVVTYVITYRDVEIMRLIRNVKSYDNVAPVINSIVTATSWEPGTNLKLTVNATDDYDQVLYYAVTSTGNSDSATWSTDNTVTLNTDDNFIHVKDSSDNEVIATIKVWDLGTNSDKKVFGYKKEDGELVVTGSGPTLDLFEKPSKNPWKDEERNSFTKLTFEEGVTTLGMNLFKFMNNVSEIHLSSTVNHKSSNIVNSLNGTNNFNRITIAEGNTYFKLIDEYTLSNMDETAIYLHSRNDPATNYTITSDKVSILSGAFYKNTNIQVINANKIVNIYASAFEGCTDLTTINAEIATSEIQTKAFCGDISLSNITISKKLNEILGLNIFQRVPGPVYYYASCSKMVEYVTEHPYETDFRLIDDVKPTTNMPTLKASSSTIVVTSNQTDKHSNIVKVEYNISTVSGSYDETKWQTEDYYTNLIASTEYYIVTRATDAAGNISVSKEASITTKKVPDNITFSATPTDPTRGNVVVTIEWPETDIENLYGNGWPAETTVTRQIGMKNNGESSITWQTATSGTNTFTVSENNTTIYARLYDGKNYTAGTISLTVANIDRVAPTGSVTINNGDAETLGQNITLNLTATDNMSKGVTYYYASESNIAPTGNLSTEEWKNYTGNGNYDFKLTYARGNKKVYVWFMDYAGNVSTAYSDTIILLANAVGLEQSGVTTYYDTLNEAIDASLKTSPSVASRITLLKDISGESSIKVLSTQSIVIDMNGFTITKSSNTTIKGIENAGKLRIENTSSTDSKIIITTTNGDAYGIYNTGLVDVNGVSIDVTASGSAIGIYNVNQ